MNYYSIIKYETLDANLNLLSLILFNPIDSIKAKVSPGESGSFNSSDPITLPLTYLDFIISKHILVGLYKSRSK